jgi:hypothetical protein
VGGSESAAESEAPKRRGLKLTLSVVGVLVVLVALAFGVMMLREDRTKNAKTGDCIASDEQVSRDNTTQTGARIVDCASSEAEFTVVARVDGETDLNGDACQQYFTAEGGQYFVYASDSGKGYLLCLKGKS